MANLDEWAKNVAGRYIDVDGWAGAQCWDLSQHWLTTCNGGTLWTQPSRFPGLAAGSWEVALANGNDMLSHVTAHPGTDRGQPGDIIIWAYGSADYPISHTAVLIEDHGATLYTLSQNSSAARPDLPGYSVESSGPTIYQELPRAGILGFLRPRATITGQGSNITPITSQEDDDMPTLDEIFNHPIKRADGKGDITLSSMLRYYSGDIASILENVKPINTAKGPLSLRQAVADGRKASQEAAAQTADINTSNGPESLRQFVATGTRAAQKLEPIVVDIAKAVKADDVDGKK